MGFAAVLLLTERRKTANPLSISGLSGSIMFNPKKRGIYNQWVRKWYCSRAFAGFLTLPITLSLPYNYIYFCCYFVACCYLCRR